VPSTEEIARHVGVSPQVVRYWGKKGLLPPAKKALRGRRGNALVWPEGAELQATWVHRRLEEGRTVEDILEALARGEYNGGK